MLVLAPVLDLVVVVVFAAVGRRNHGEGDALTGILTTAWPFALAALLGWLVVVGARRVPAAGLTMPGGVVVWVSTVAVGMVLRHLTGRGVAISFVIVSLVFTGVFMLGWRIVARLVGARRART